MAGCESAGKPDALQTLREFVPRRALSRSVWSASGLPALSLCPLFLTEARESASPLSYALLSTHCPHPLLVIQIPLHGFANAFFEGVGWAPAEVALDFRGVDGVAAVVAGAVFDEGDQLARVVSEFGGQFIDQIAN